MTEPKQEDADAVAWRWCMRAKSERTARLKIEEELAKRKRLEDDQEALRMLRALYPHRKPSF